MNFIKDPNRISLYDADNTLIAEVTFPDIDADTVDINHTFVDSSLRGQGVAGQLMEAAATQIRTQKKKAVLTCSYAISWFSRHSEHSDILKQQ